MYIKTGEGLGGERAPKLSFATVWINTFKTCNQKLLEHCDDVANGFGKVMKIGGHTWAINFKENEAKPEDWIDRAHGGKDTKPGRGVNTVDLAMLVTHGGLRLKNEEKAHPALHVTAAFDQAPCRLRSHQMRFGKEKLRWLILDSCHSLEIDKNKSIMPDEIWHDAFDGLHTMFGFDGVTSDAWWTEDRGEDFAFSLVAGDAEMADAWIDAAYSYQCDDTPVAMTAGRDAKDADHRLETERLSSSFDSIPNKEVKYLTWMRRS